MIKKIKNKSLYYYNRNEELRQFITYFFIGGMSALSDIIFLFILVEVFHIYYLTAAIISFISISTVAFFLHKNLTFRHEGRNNKLRYLVFLSTAASGLLWSVGLLFVFVEFFNMWYLAAAVITKFIVFLWNFLMNKFVTFGKFSS